MYCQIIKNHILKNKTTTLTTTFFITAAAMLISLAAIITVHLAGSLDTLMNQAQTPHFMQMHSGHIDTGSLDAFASKSKEIEKYQILEFLNLEGAQMVFEGKPLTSSTQDNGLTVQSDKFDYLLDLSGNIINAKKGQLYVPICYMKDNTLRAGDKASICGRKFTIAGFLRDSQMNSSLSSSKRFLVSREDYNAVKALGKIEYLIEFRLKDISDLSAFEAAYASAGLPSNGPAVTYPLFKAINAFSDGMMIGLLLLMSLLVVAIAFLCIRFTLLAQIEDDYREIGVMKGIGLRVSHIQKIYLMKFAAMGLFGCIAGYVLSLLFKEALTKNIRLFLGESDNTLIASLFCILGVMLVFAAILAYVKILLRRFGKISAAEAIQLGTGQEKSVSSKYFCLSSNRLLSTNFFLGINNVLAEKRLYATMLAVIILASFIQILPQNVYHTISAEEFCTYMGIGSCDIRVDIQQTDRSLEKANEIVTAMNEDDTFSKVNLLTTKMFRTGSDEMIKVELGNHSIFPVAYSTGKAPITQNEIALSSINADELSKQAGDSITLFVEGEKREFIVCGIYSDITNGGKTAKAAFTDSSTDTMWNVICAGLEDKSLINEKVSQYQQAFPFAKISGIREYITQTFGQTILSVKTASYTAIAIALLLTLLITLLFMKMLIARDTYSIAVLKALGFKNRDIRIQYAVRAISVLAAGIVIGTVLANTLGEIIADMAISSFGASSFSFMINPVWAYILCPLMMGGTVLIATLAGVIGAGKISIRENSSPLM